MNWQSLDHFLSMGGHGLYVWGSYAVTLGVLAAETVLSRHRHRRALADARSALALGGQP